MIDYSKLSDEDLIALKENRLQDVSDEGLVSLKQSPNEAQVETSPMEAFVRGAAETASFGFADEVEAGVDTAIDIFKGDSSFTEASATYNENLDVAREEFKKNAEDHPIASGAGTVAGALVPGLGAARGAQAGIKGLLAVGAAEGAVFGFGSSEDKASLEGVMDTLEGAGFGLLGSGIGAAAQKIGSKLVQSATPEAKKLLNKALIGIGLGKDGQRKKAFKKMSQRNKDPMEWLKNIAAETKVEIDPNTGEIVDSGKKLINNVFDSPSTILDKVDNKIGFYNDMRDNILVETGKSFDRVTVANMIKGKLAGKINVGDMEHISKVIDNTFVYTSHFDNKVGEMVPKLIEEPMDALSLRMARTALDNNINFQSVANVHNVKRTLRTALNDITDDIVESTSGKDAKNQARALRAKMSDLFILKENLEDAVIEESFGSASFVKDAVAGASASMMSQGIGMQNKAVAPLAMGLRRAAVSESFNKLGSFGRLNAKGEVKLGMMGRLAEAIEKVPVSSVNRLVLASQGDDIAKFQSIAASVEAEADLSQNPLPRSISAVRGKQDQIMALVRDSFPEVANDLKRAFNKGDIGTIGSILSQLEKSEDGGKFFQEGIGFDGKVYAEEDKVVLRQQVNNANIPTVQRLQMLQDLDVNGTIPNMEAVVPRQPNVYRPKRDNEPDY